jgi:hypothetical protein
LQPRRSAALIVALVALVATACASSKITRGVDVKAVNTDVGLGVEPVLGPAPGNIVVRKPIPREQLGPIVYPTLPPFEIETPTPASCPRAGDFDFPEKDAGVDPPPDIRPSEGAYKYFLEGKIESDTGKVDVRQFETRVLSDVKDDTAAPDAYSFTMQQSQLLDERVGYGKLITTYRVVPTGNFRTVPNPPAPAPGVSDTGRGLYLVSIVFQGVDDEGKPFESRFDPSNPLLLLPYPVVQGTDINASGTDPQTGTQVTITGEVKGKKQVDACGERVDTWLIDAVESYRFSDPDTFQTETIEADYDYGVAPQFGGMILYEKVIAPREGPIIKLEARVGSVPKAGKA